MTSPLTLEQQDAINKAIRNGLRSLERPEPLRLSEWADQNFYLSAESSYEEGRWEAFPFQRAIMDCISNDDIRDLTFIKSARVGYTKMILAAMGYFAEHKRRNQCVWQPVDDDADEFVKTELDPMIRDVPAVQAIFPWYSSKHKNNTLRQKVFASGKNLHIRGGKAAKNYRRLSVDVAYLDELDGFDEDIEKEGDPVTLAAKRVEGSTFPKVITGSTPKHSGSLTERRSENAERYFKYHIPCPHCDHMQTIQFGGRDADFGFKWVGDNALSVGCLCKQCGALFTQSDYLDVWERGKWMTEDGVWIDGDSLFRDAKSHIVDTPLSVAFHIWTAYSPMTSWAQIVREFLAAKDDPSQLKTFTNTTLGETWEDDQGEKIEGHTLKLRREHYGAEAPDGVQAITFGIDTQDDRFEIQFDGWGPGEERWTLDYVRLFGDPSRPQIWDRLEDVIHRQFKKRDGSILTPIIGCQDHGGHYSDEVNKFSKRVGIRYLIPVKGSSVYGKQIATFPRKRNRNGVYLTEIGTDTAKDAMFFRLKILNPGPGYWHFPVSEAFDDEYYKQLTAEQRLLRWAQGKKRVIWDSKGRRNEPWDCSVYSLAAIRIAQQHFGLRLEELKRKPIAARPRGVMSEGVKR